MKTLFIKIIIFIIFCPLISIGQVNYFEYWRLYTNVQDEVIDSNFTEALIYLDSIYSNYDLMYAEHAVVGAKLSVVTKDTLSAIKYIKKCISQGTTLDILEKDPFISQMIDNEVHEIIMSDFDSLQAAYYSRINWPLRKTIDSLFVVDQEITAKVNKCFLNHFKWRKVSNRQAKILYEITQKYGYPGEFIIGSLDNNNEGKLEYNYDSIPYRYILFNEKKAFFMFVHYFSDKVPFTEYNKILLAEVKKGNMEARQFGALQDFQSRWRKDKNYYNVWHYDPDITNIDAINARRKEIGIGDFTHEKKTYDYGWYLQRNHLYKTRIRI